MKNEEFWMERAAYLKGQEAGFGVRGIALVLAAMWTEAQLSARLFRDKDVPTESYRVVVKREIEDGG